jgi:hypothetical protein
MRHGLDGRWALTPVAAHSNNHGECQTARKVITGRLPAAWAGQPERAVRSSMLHDMISIDYTSQVLDRWESIYSQPRAVYVDD